MAIKWIKTAHKGLRYYEHPTRRHGKKRDRYYAIRFKVANKDYSYGVGWWSEGIPDETRKDDPQLGFEEYALKLLRQYQGNIKAGSGPRSPKEKRSIEAVKREREDDEQKDLKRQNIPFGSFMTETYLPQCKRDKKDKTYINEEGLYRLHLEETVGALPFHKIAPFHIERIKKTMSDKGLSNRTIQYVLQLTRQVFNLARHLGLFTGDPPTKAVKWPKLDNMKLRYLSIGEAEKLLASLATKSRTLHDVALLSLHAGLRFGEIAKLTWSCANWEAGTIAILDAKTGSRTAYPTERAKEMLKNRQRDVIKKAESDPDSRYKGNPDELIFPKRSGTDGSMAQASKVFRDTVNDLKLNEGITDRKQKVTFHTLRHSYATLLYERTHDLYLTQRSLGHATGTMTARYAKMSENRLREGAAALEKAFASGTKQTEQAKAEQQVVNLAQQ